MSNKTAKRLDMGALDAAIGAQEPPQEVAPEVAEAPKERALKSVRVDFTQAVIFPDAKGSPISLHIADTSDQQRKMPKPDAMRFEVDGLHIDVEREGRGVSYFYPWTSVKSVQRVHS